VLVHDVQRVDAERAVRLEIALELLREECVPEGLFRHAAAEAGMKREEGVAELLAIRNGERIYSVRWLFPQGTAPGAARDAFLRALLARAPGLGLRVVSAREVGTPPS
jgi:hypothetical protein